MERTETLITQTACITPFATLIAQFITTISHVVAVCFGNNFRSFDDLQTDLFQRSTRRTTSTLSS